MQLLKESGIYMKNKPRKEVYMAKRRVFSIEVVESMEFLRLSKEAQLLYFFLMLHTDDEGVIINHEVVVKITDSSLKALEELTESGMLTFANRPQYWNAAEACPKMMK